MTIAAARRAGLIIVVAVSAVMAHSSASIAEKGVVPLAEPGLHTLQDLGASPVTIESVNPAHSSPSIPYRLRDRATQGPDDWYLIVLDAEVTVNPGARGIASISASTNGKSAALIQIEQNAQSVVWTSRDLFNGPVGVLTGATTFPVRLVNYLQTDGVHAGDNELQFKLDQSGPGPIESVRIKDDSGIFITSVAPPKLALSLHLPTTGLVAGAPFDIGFTLTNSGPPARGVVVRVRPITQGLAADGESLLPVGTVDGSASGHFRLIAATSDRQQFGIDVQSQNAGQPSTDVDLPIGSQRSTNYFSPLLLIPLTALLIGFALMSLGNVLQWIRRLLGHELR